MTDHTLPARALPRPSTRTAIAMAAIAAGLLVGAAACGGGKTGSAIGNSATSPTPEAAAPMEPGTSGFPGVDWGDTIKAIQARYPAATAHGEDGLELRAKHGGLDATASFSFVYGALTGIDVTFTDKLESMAACAEPFQHVRADLERSLGPGTTHDLAAYWNAETATMTLICDADDAGPTGHAKLTMSYTQPPEE